MILVAYVVLGLMFAVYVALDGYDLGVAIVSPAVARSDADRADADGEHRAVLERQRGLADRGRRHAVRVFPASLRFRRSAASISR